MMNKVHIQNLAMIITDKCNLNCEHCMRGLSGNTHMDEQIIRSSLDQICNVDNLIVGGGEPSIALVPLYYLLKYVKNNKIDIERIITLINGTVYSKDFLELLEGFQLQGIDTCLHISADEYHTKEIQKLEILKEYKQNLIHYRKTDYYKGMRLLNKNSKLFREGNAVHLDESLTMDIIPSKVYLTYTNKDGEFDKNGLCTIGPMVTINQEGIITEYQASYENQRNLYNYGNVLEDSIEDICLKRGRVLKPIKFKEQCNKELKKYQ